VKWRLCSIRVIPLAALAVACCNVPNPYFDGDDDTAAGSGSDHGTHPDGSTADSSDDGGDGGGDGDGDDTSGGGSTDGGDTTDPGVDQDCTDFIEPVIVLAANADLEAPMAMDESPEEGKFAYSEVENEGTITFTASLPCSDDFHIWGRALDDYPGTHVDDDPDSYYVSVDEPAASPWYYGCQTWESDAGWSWNRVDTAEYGTDCGAATPIIPRLAGGHHTITLRNREGIANDGRLAGIARLLLTNDPDYVPSSTD